MTAVIECTDLKKYFCKASGVFARGGDAVKAVDGVSFSVEKGKTFGLVGESGSGKSTVAKLVTGILSPDEGHIQFSGEMDMVFQDPNSSLNPRMTARDIVGESLLVRGVRRDDVRHRADEALEMVRLHPASCGSRYPHQFSGGERQRIAIARALVRRPELVVLDEPVSSLDVSIQAGILNLLKDLQDELELSYIFISHDLRVVEFMSDTVAVMKSGRFVEVAPAVEIYAAPKHEYTRYLLECIPGTTRRG
jgi:ABC-type glutathione transport system ATPase component